MLQVPFSFLREPPIVCVNELGGVIGDLFEIVPALTKAAKEAKA